MHPSLRENTNENARKRYRVHVVTVSLSIRLLEKSPVPRQNHHINLFASGNIYQGHGRFSGKSRTVNSANQWVKFKTYNSCIDHIDCIFIHKNNSIPDA